MVAAVVAAGDPLRSGSAKTWRRLLIIRMIPALTCGCPG